MRSRLVSAFSTRWARQDPGARCRIPYAELGAALLPLINPAIGAKYGR
jgi:hypothetical protein